MKKIHEFIKLKLASVGFVVYGLGGGADQCTYRGVPLLAFLRQVQESIFALKSTLNRAWGQIDRNHSEHSVNRGPISELLSAATWAYALTVDLQAFSKACEDGPTDPLRHFWLNHLEEIYTKCFAAAHLYGTIGESAVGLRGLLTDFELNGGINHKSGKAGPGFDLSFTLYYIAYFESTERTPIAYQRFGELMSGIAQIVERYYPAVKSNLVREFQRMLEEAAFGFGSLEIKSKAKTELREHLATLAGSLGKISKAA